MEARLLNNDFKSDFSSHRATVTIPVMTISTMGGCFVGILIKATIFTDSSGLVKN